MISGIYAIVNLQNDKFYVGSAKNIYKRWHIHKSNLKHNKHDNSYLQRSWNKYGSCNFILVILEITGDLENREQYWIDTTKCYNKEIGYNSRLKANNNSGFKHSVETKSKISASKYGRKASDETKAKQSASSAVRNKIKWPHKLGAKCKCDECKEKHRIRNRNHMREWREANRYKYNEYMRNYNKNKPAS